MAARGDRELIRIYPVSNTKTPVEFSNNRQGANSVPNYQYFTYLKNMEVL